MKRYLFLLVLPLLFATCKKQDDVSANTGIVGRWSLVAQRDTTGAWQPFRPLVPITIEFRKDGAVDYLNSAGQPQRNCCQPTQYVIRKPEPCLINASCLKVVFLINFTDHVLCQNAFCALPPGWTAEEIDDMYLTIYSDRSSPQITGLRFQRVR